jgi:uncharacterized protein YndB with AHSA1/START domain
MHLASDLGSYIEHDGRPAVRFVRTYPHSQERVWRAISEPGELRHWFPSGVEIEPRSGGAIAFADDPYAAAATGQILVWEPPRRLAFTWYADELHFTLDEVDGGCRLTLVNVLDDRTTAARNAGGWYVCLEELAKSLDGVPSRGPHSDDTVPWEPVYRAHVDAGLPSGAPVPDIATG